MLIIYMTASNFKTHVCTSLFKLRYMCEWHVRSWTKLMVCSLSVTPFEEPSKEPSDVTVKHLSLQ